MDQYLVKTTHNKKDYQEALLFYFSIIFRGNSKRAALVASITNVIYVLSDIVFYLSAAFLFLFFLTARFLLDMLLDTSVSDYDFVVLVLQLFALYMIFYICSSRYISNSKNIDLSWKIKTLKEKQEGKILHSVLFDPNGFSVSYQKEDLSIEPFEFYSYKIIDRFWINRKVLLFFYTDNQSKKTILLLPRTFFQKEAYRRIKIWVSHNVSR